MAAPSMTLIQTVTVGSGGSSTIDLNSIPQTFTDIQLVFNTRDNGNPNGYPVAGVDITFNGVTTNRTARLLYGAGSGSGSAGSYTTFPAWQPTSVATANTFGSASLYIPNYSGAAYKSFTTDGVTENNGTMAYGFMLANVWSSTTSISRITLTPESGTFAPGSTASLYGVQAGTSIEQAPSTGGLFFKSGGYWYHVFTSSGTFTPNGTITADVLMVGGGGGGGYAYGGGGSAGAVALYTGQALSSPKTVSIGAGGGSGYYNNGNGGSGYAGSATSFTGLTNAAGGAGGVQGASTGGSGAGGARSGQNGGPGIGTYSSWATATGTGVSGYYAGGGGGGGYTTTGNGGSGGGGFGGAYANSQYGGDSGIANTGSGGGGGYSGSGAGGSGLVIVRYAA